MAEHEKTCDNCAHFQEQTESSDPYRWGECRRYPPVWYFDGEDAVCQHAQADASGLCGEWKAKQ